MRSVFTNSLTKEVKRADRVCIELDELTGFVYVSTASFLVKLNMCEYDRFIRPITNRDPGTFSFIKGEYTDENIMRDIGKLLYKSHTESAYNLIPTPITFDYSAIKPFTFDYSAIKPYSNIKYKIVTYYSYENDYVSGFNYNYTSIIKATLYRSKDSISPMVCYDGMVPVAMILPLRLSQEGKPNRISAAVKAYFKAQVRTNIKTENHQPFCK